MLRAFRDIYKNYTREENVDFNIRKILFFLPYDQLDIAPVSGPETRTEEEKQRFSKGNNVGERLDDVISYGYYRLHNSLVDEIVDAYAKLKDGKLKQEELDDLVVRRVARLAKIIDDGIAKFDEKEI